MNPHSHPYKFTASNPAKFSHRRINTEIQHPTRNYVQRDQWQPSQYQSRPIQSLRFIRNMPSQYTRNNQYNSNINNNDKATRDKNQIYNQGNTRTAGHRRIKTVIDPPQQNSTNNRNNNYQNYPDKKNIKGVYEQVNSESKQSANSNKNKESRFQKMQLEFSKYQKQTQKQTAATSTPTGVSSTKSPQYKYAIQGIAGKGTFGVVYFGRVRLTGEKIAIKKVLQDKRYKNRELQILECLDNDNLLKMKDHFFTKQGDQQYLNVIMDYFPDNLYQIIKKKVLTPTLIKQFTYQALKGLEYLAQKSIAHRDIKPQNILVDLKKNKIVICDFGSAKKLKKGQSNIAYICSRCYRAPQLIFGAKQYSPQIDVWSLGCVVVQMINGQAPFLGDSQLDQLLEIIKVLGTPQKTQIRQMNPQYNLKDYKSFPSIKPVPWHKILKCIDPLLIDLVTKMLEYSPIKRVSAKEALEHPYFQQLRQQQNQQPRQQININMQSISLHKTYSGRSKGSSQQISLQSPHSKMFQGSSHLQQDKSNINKSQQQLFEVKHNLKNKPPIKTNPISQVQKKEDEDEVSWQKQQLSYTKTKRQNPDRALKLRDQIVGKKMSRYRGTQTANKFSDNS